VDVREDTSGTLETLRLIEAGNRTNSVDMMVADYKGQVVPESALDSMVPRRSLGASRRFAHFSLKSCVNGRSSQSPNSLHLIP
jgi:hypothetical protein